MFSKDFAKEIFEGNKSLMKNDEVRMVRVTKFDELSVKKLYNKFLTLDLFENYMPKKFAKGRQCDRDYMFIIANTLHQDVVTELVTHALKVRHHVDAAGMKMETIKISEHWVSEMDQLPLVARVRIHLQSLTLFTE